MLNAVFFLVGGLASLLPVQAHIGRQSVVACDRSSRVNLLVRFRGGSDGNANLQEAREKLSQVPNSPGSPAAPLVHVLVACLQWWAKKSVSTNLAAATDPDRKKASLLMEKRGLANCAKAMPLHEECLHSRR